MGKLNRGGMVCLLWLELFAIRAREGRRTSTSSYRSLGPESRTRAENSVIGRTSRETAQGEALEWICLLPYAMNCRIRQILIAPK